MSVNARVQKHRAKLREEQCRRFEVWIGLGVIDNVREFAKRKKVSTWEVVQDALLKHIENHQSLVACNSQAK